MRAVLCGANGAMGKLIDGQLPQEVAGRVSLDGENGVARTFAQLGPVEADVVMDFSHHSAISDVLAYAKGIGAAAVIGTTGHTEAEKAEILAAPFLPSMLTRPAASSFRMPHSRVPMAPLAPQMTALIR